MEDPAGLVENSERLVGLFEGWPSFHDAEVIEFNLWRGDIAPEADRWVFPVLTTRIHLWDTTPAVNAEGRLATRRHTHATLRFHALDDFKMDGFNHQNAIYGMSIARENSPEHSFLRLRVVFEGAHGLSATFRCSRIEVTGVEPAPPED